MAEDDAINEVSVDDAPQDDSSDGLDEVILEGLDDGAEDQPVEEARKQADTIPVEDFEKLKGDYERASKHINDLNKALSESRTKLKEKETAKAEEPQLSKEQLKQMFKEYQDDPDTLFAITQYMAEQAAKGASGKAIETAKIGENKKQIDSYLSTNYPDLAKPESPLRSAVDKTVAEMGLSDNPYGDFLAIGVQTVLNMPKLMKQAYDSGRKDEAGGKAEKSRKEIVKESGLTPKGKGSSKSVSATLSETQMETAKKLGLKGDQLKTFSRIINKGASSVSMGG